MRWRSIFRGTTPSSAGFSLLEVAVALAILSFALLTSLAFLGHRAKNVEQLEVHRQAIRSLSVAHEAMRFGDPVPLVPTPAGSGAVWDAELPAGARLWQEVRDTDEVDLHEVDLIVRYPSQAGTSEARITTLVWVDAP